MTTRHIPFSDEDRATIRRTAQWMLVAGGAMVAADAYLLLRVAMVAGDAPLGALLVPFVVVATLGGFGVLILVGSRAFAQVAVDGQVAALSRGFTALTCLYVVQALLLLLVFGLFVLMILAPMVL